MDLHSSRTSTTVRVVDIIMSIAILSATTYLFVERLEFVRDTEAQANSQQDSEIVESPVQNDPEPEPGKPVKIAKPVKSVAAKPKPSTPSPSYTGADGYQPRDFNAKGYQARGFNRRGFNPR